MWDVNSIMYGLSIVRKISPIDFFVVESGDCSVIFASARIRAHVHDMPVFCSSEGMRARASIQSRSGGGDTVFRRWRTISSWRQSMASSNIVRISSGDAVFVMRSKIPIWPVMQQIYRWGVVLYSIG